MTWRKTGGKPSPSCDYADLPALPAKPAANSQLLVGITEMSA
jgi:hypothetical protein